MFLKLWVPGIPATAGSKTPFKNKYTGKVMMVPANKRQKPWQADIKHFASNAYLDPPVTDPVELKLTFVFPRPKYHYGTGKNKYVLKPNAPFYVDKKPDLSKCTRAVEDALIGVAFKDDALVVKQEAMQIYGDSPGVLIEVRVVK